MNFTRLRLILILCLLAAFLPASPALAQDNLPVYTVQSGDTLGGLSLVFHTPVSTLITANNISNPDALVPGTQLFIPSLQGYTGEVSLIPLAAGETTHTLARQLGITDADLDRINFLTQPEALPVSASVVVLNQSDKKQTRVPVSAGLTDLEFAAASGINPWTVSETNHLRGPWELLQNDTLYLPVAPASDSQEQLPGVSQLKISQTPLEQGKTVLFSASVADGVTLTGTLNGQPLEFLPDADGVFSAYSGTPRLQDPGVYPMFLTATAADGQTYTLQQNLLVKLMTSYGVDYPFQVADELVDPAVTVPEMDEINKIVAPITAEKYWSGAFVPPTPTPDCITSGYGRLRSYNGSDYIYFHSGRDYCGSTTTPIFAAADGVVVFTGKLTVRGNATIIDHGRGVYTGYWHQSEFKVQVGDHVKAGQEIGIVGATGRVTGPHLHFEVFVGGVQVDPAEWLAGDYP